MKNTKTLVLSIFLMICVCVGLFSEVPTKVLAVNALNMTQVKNWLDYEISSAQTRGSGECVDFCNYYLTNCWGNSSIGGNAGTWKDKCPQGWTIVNLNGSFDNCRMGDLLVEYYSPGHVSVYYGKEGGKHYVVDQNNNGRRNTGKGRLWADFSNPMTCFRPPIGSVPASANISVNFSPWENGSFTYIHETDASIGQEITVSGGTCTDSGIYLYDVNGNLLAKAANGSYYYRIYFKVNEELGYKLTPGTTYKYKFYAIVNGQTYWSNEYSFKTGGTAPASVSVNFTPWENSNYTYIRDTDAAIGMNLSVSNGRPSYVGMVLFSSSGTELAHGGESNDYIGPYYFKINGELGYRLTMGTNYKYKFYAVVNGKTYWSNEYSFKTTGTASVNYSISLSKSSLSMTVGNSTSLSASVSPTGTQVSWSSSNTGVATVNGGLVKAVGAGTATVTATAGGKAASCTVNVTPATVAVAKVMLNNTSISLKLGENAILSATVEPTNATNKTITWVSSNPNVAAVKDGEVFSMGVGSATITATSNNKSASCIVTVAEADVSVTGVSLDKSSLEISVGESTNLIATVKPSNATNADITWTTNNTSVVNVSNGMVTAVGAGTATVTATAGSKFASCTVTVKEQPVFKIGTASIRSATVGTDYSQKLVANSTYVTVWNVTVGSLPDGLLLSEDGVISGTPTSVGSYIFTVTATSKTGMDSKNYTLEVNGNTDVKKANVHFERKNIYHQDQFTDVKANQWFTSTVASAFELGLIKGSSATTFNPYGDVTIAEAITMAARVHCINQTGTERFVQTGTWYQVYLDYAYQNGIIDYAYYNSDVAQKATRAQFAEIFAKSLPTDKLPLINQIADNSVPDVAMSESYSGSVYKLYRAGILTGSDVKGSFAPQTYITRAEAATILSRMGESNNRVEFSLGN